MGESGDTSARKGYQPWWSDRAAWREKFKVVHHVFGIGEGRDKPLPPWTEEDIEEFAKDQPEYGAQLKVLRQAGTTGVLGAAAGGVVSAGFILRQNRSFLGAALGGLLGAAVGWGLAGEGSTIALGTNKFNPIETNLKFLEWWKAKSEG